MCRILEDPLLILIPLIRAVFPQCVRPLDSLSAADDAVAGLGLDADGRVRFPSSGL